MKIIGIHTEYIQLDQALKKEGLIQTGGEVSFFIKERDVLLNGKKVTEKRKKLRPGDILSIGKEQLKIVDERNEKS